ncbi:GNAT family N-acetyltransferase [Rhizobium sp. LjRoot254]|uniref:GNAT family N-acetyltransferase n=1 Tax=Rhizobium sp. LjRoot254 TaxID=3342297 RepID=UPI003ECDAABC
MKDVAFEIEMLSGHDRTRFDCGVPELNNYLKMRATQDMKRRVASCFVAIEKPKHTISGFYTLSACHLLLTDISELMKKALPLYPEVPAIRLGRLAVDQTFRGKGVGSLLLADAIRRSLKLEIGAALILVDAKNQDAANFYRHFGFEALQGKPLQLAASLKSFARFA